MGPSASGTVSDGFDSFVDRVFEPYLTVVSTSIESTTEPDPHAPSGDEEEGFEVESIKKKRVRSREVQYLVKLARWNNRFNRWLSVDDLQCDELIAEFESRQAESALFRFQGGLGR